MKYIYPRLSQYDLNILRLGGPGLGNLLFTYSRAVAESKKNNIPMIWPTWYSLKIGPYIRHEMDKRKYNDLFTNNSNYISGVKKIWLRCTRKVVNRNQIKSIENVDSGIIEYTGMADMFEPIIDDYELIRNDLICNLQVQNRGWSDFNFTDSISVHIRLGDFQRGTTEQLKCGSQNTSTPVEWYCSMIQQIRAAVGRNMQVYVFSDGTEEELRDILHMPNVQRITFGNSISDIMALSKANLFLASGSTFSMWARFLGRMNVIAYEGQLLQTLKREGENFFEMEMADVISKKQMDEIIKLF